MSLSQTILRNIVCNLGGYAVHFAVVLYLTPFVLQQLGDIRYGLWILASSLTGHYGLLSLGLRSGVNQYLTRYLAQNNFSRVNSVLSTSVVVLSFVGALIIAIAASCAYLLPKLVDVPVELIDDLRWSLIIIGISAGIQMPSHSFAAVFTATQRFDITNAIGVLTRLLSAGLIYSLLTKGYGLVGISLAILASELLGHILRWKIAHQIVPGLAFKVRSFSWAQLTEMMSFGSWAFVIALSQSIFEAADVFVITGMLPIAAIAYYSLAAGLVRKLEGVLRPIDQVFFPAATALHSENKAESLQHLYLKGSRLTLMALAFVTIPTCLWAEDFYRLWVGDTYLISLEFTSVAVLFTTLAIAMVARQIPAVGLQMLFASRKVKPLALLLLLEGAANLGLSVFFAQEYGLFGVALGTLVSAILFRAIATSWLVWHELSTSILVFWNGSLKRPLIYATSFTGSLVLLKTVVEPASSFFHISMQGFAAAAIGTLLGLAIGFKQDERQQFLYSPWDRMKAQIRLL